MQQDEDLHHLDKLIADFGDGRYDLLLEHLQTARRSLLGCMPGEYRMSLEQAKDSLAFIPGKGTRAETTTILRNLIESRQ